MQKNNLCPLPNKILVYEEIDTISQFIFNSKASKYYNIKNKDNNKRNKICGNNLYKRVVRYNTYSKFQKYFEKNYNIFFCNILLKRFDYKTINKKNYLISNFYSIKETKIIFPKREFYYRHHLEFLERPNLISSYFKKIEKEYGIRKSNEYQNQKKKENSIKKKGENNQKIFDTNILEEIENYSTTITQASNNEKIAAITPFEIFRRCEDNKRLLQKENIIEKNNEKNIDLKSEKEKDANSKFTFSESGISIYSKNIEDESLIKMIKELSEKPKKYKQEVKKLSTFFNKKKEALQKLTKFNKKINNMNSSQKVNGINKFIKKEIKKEKKISTSNNKKNKKLIIYDSINNQNMIKKITSNSKTKSNKNYPSFNIMNKKKEVLNLKRQSFKRKRHTVQLDNNFKNNINKNNLVSISINNIDDLIKMFLTPKNNKKYGDKVNIIKKQNKKNSALTIINNVYDNNRQKRSNSQSEGKYKKIKISKLYKSKSPLIRLFMTGNNEKSEENKNYKKRKSVLYPESYNNLLVKSVNFTNRKNYLYRNKNRQKNAITLSQNFDSIMKNLLK